MPSAPPGYEIHTGYSQDTASTYMNCSAATVVMARVCSPNLASLQHPPFWSAWNYSGNFYYNCYTPPGMQQLHGDPP